MASLSNRSFDVHVYSPGLDDPAGPEKDNDNIAEMVKELKKLDTVHLFFIIFNGQVPRMTRFLATQPFLFK